MSPVGAAWIFPLFWCK